MILTNCNIILRYIKESDIEDYNRWLTTETEWGDWDAPWEEDGACEFLERQKANLVKVPNTYAKLEIDTLSGQHIGWVSSYYIDGYTDKKAVGIDIPPIDARGKKYGENALSLFMAYLFIHCNKNILYTQTWSGNTAMLRLAEKIGFVEVERIKNLRKVRGKNYDALTLSISKESFFNRYSNLSTE